MINPEVISGVVVPQMARQEREQAFRHEEGSHVVYEGSVVHEGRTLHQYSLSINPESMVNNPKFTRREVEIMQKYNTEIRIWTARYLEPSKVAELRRNPRTVSVGLFEGISTNHDQWTRESASLVHNAFRRIEKTLLKYGEEDRDIFVYALSCVGFGGSPLRNEPGLQKEDVSVFRYMEHADISVRFLQLDGIQLGVAHSAAGEVLRLAPYFGKLSRMAGVAVHPSLNVDGALQFSVLNRLSKLGRGVRRHVPYSDILVRQIEKLVVGYTTGKDGPIEGFTAQVLMHILENAKHPYVLAMKMNELGEEDIQISPDVQAVGNIPITVTGESDKITYLTDIVKWHESFLISLEHQLHKRGLRVTPPNKQKPVQTSFSQKLAKHFLRVGPFGHDAMLYNREAQEFVLDALSDQLEKELKKVQNSTLNTTARRMGEVNNGSTYVEFYIDEDAVEEDPPLVHSREVVTESQDLGVQLVEEGQENILYRLDQIKTYINWLHALGLVKELDRDVDMLKALGWPGGQVYIPPETFIEMYQYIVDSNAKSRSVSQLNFQGESALNIFKRAVLYIINDRDQFPEVHLNSLFNDETFVSNLRRALVIFALAIYEADGGIYIPQNKLEEVLEIIHNTRHQDMPVLDESSHPSVAINFSLPAGMSDVVALYELTK